MATYYLSNANPVGSDAAAGTIAAPWLTLAKVISSTANGDTIYLNSGCVWRESHDVPHNTMTYDKYGTGTPPILSGSDVMSGFTNGGSNIWDLATVAIQPNIVWISGVLGALQASRAAITAPGHWFWTGTTLSVYATSDPSGLVEAGQRLHCWWTWAKTDTTVKNIIFEKNNALSNNACVKTSNTSPNTIYDGIEVRDACGGGINLGDNALASILRNSYIHRTGQGSLTLGAGCGCYVSTDNCIIENTRFDRCGLIGSTGNHSIYINVPGTSGTMIRFCRFDNGLTSHITSRGPSTVIHHNVFLRSGPEYKAAAVTDYAFTNETSGGSVFYHNTIVGLWRGVQTLTGQVGVTYKNNIFAFIENRIFDMNDATAISSDYNVVFPFNTSQWPVNTWPSEWSVYQSGSGQDAHSLNVDPLLADWHNGNFHLLPNSPAIDKGLVIAGYNDGTGGSVLYAGSAPNIGAWENEFEWVSGDRIRELTYSVGATEPLLLRGVDAADLSFRPFSAICEDGNLVEVNVKHRTAAEWETVLCQWTLGGLLWRQTVLASSNGGALVNFSAGTKDVQNVLPATQGIMPVINRIQNTNVVIPGGASVYIPGSHEVARGYKNELGLGAIEEVG